jgi:hypothetical protein
LPVGELDLFDRRINGGCVKAGVSKSGHLRGERAHMDVMAAAGELQQRRRDRVEVPAGGRV